jgi:hypothetical protein
MFQCFSETKSWIYNKVFYTCSPELLDFFSKIKDDFFKRVPDQSVIAGTNGERYDRAIATRGNDYLLVYNYSGRPMQIDLSKISGAKKNAWWYSAKDGKLEYIGEFDSKVTPFQHDSGYLSGNDQVLIVVDSAKDYVQKAWTALPDAIQKWNK